MNSKNRHPSGKTFVKDGRVIWEYEGENIVSIPLKKIILIAEYTTANGPFEDDWFLVFYNDSAAYFEISMYAEGISNLLTQLGQFFRIELYGALVSSTEWKSNILYPIELKGKELWNFKRIKPKSMVLKLKSLFGVYKVELNLTKVAERRINQYISE